MECFICGKPIDPDSDYHWCHEPGCGGEDCDCDLNAHPECCPDCNAESPDVKIEKLRAILSAIRPYFYKMAADGMETVISPGKVIERINQVLEETK